MSATNANVESINGEHTESSDQYTSFNSKYNRPRPCYKWVCLDLLCFVFVAVPIIVLYFVGVPYHRGFFCDDESIKKPFKHSTVSSGVATAVGLVLPAVAFVIVESVDYRAKLQKVVKGRVVGRVLYVGRLRLNSLVLTLLRVIFVFLFGAAVNVLITDVGKYSLGRLRPHFLAVCKPNINWLNCTGQFITQDVCTGDPSLIRQARLSFPSGHSSYAAYTMVFLMLYFQARVRLSSSFLVKPFLQLAPFTMAVLCGLSRVSDYKHHWSDVLAGLVLGTLVAYFTVWQLLQWFKEKPCEKQPKGLKDVV